MADLDSSTYPVVTTPAGAFYFLGYDAGASDPANRITDASLKVLFQSVANTAGKAPQRDTDGSIAVGAINLDTSASPTSQEGQIRWNATDKCAEIVQDGGVVLQAGQEITVRARNTTGSTLANGTPVYVNGATGNRPTVAKADADTFDKSSTLIGLVTDSAGIGNNSDGHVTVFGLVRDLDTSAYSEGATLYLSDGTSGTLTTTKPTATGSFVVRVGYVTRSHASQGVILVSPQYMGSTTGDAVVNAVNPAAARTAVGLGNVDNTSDANKPISTATQTALDGKASSDLSNAAAQATLSRRAYDVTNYGAVGDGVTDDWAAFAAARTAAGANGTVFFPGNKTYYFAGGTAGSAPDLSGTNISAGPGMVISVAGANAVSYKAIKAHSPFAIYIRDRTSTTQIYPNTALDPLFALSAQPISDGLAFSASDFATWSNRNYNPASGQSGYTSGSATITARLCDFSGSETANTIEGIYKAISVGQEAMVAGYVSNNNSSGELYVQVNYSGGYDLACIYDTATSSNAKKLAFQRKTGTGARTTLSTINLPDAAYGPQVASCIHLGAKLVSARKVEVYVNGWFAGSISAPADVADVGFAMDCPYYSAIGTFNDPVIKTGGWAGGGRTRRIVVAGDSIGFGEGAPYGFADLLPTALAGQPKVSAATVTNVSVSGYTAGQAKTVLDSTDLTGVDVVVLCVGANDVFVQSSVSSFETALAGIKTRCDTYAAKLVVCSVPMSTWRPPGASSPTRNNYGLGGKLRASLYYWAATNGVEVADLQYALGANGVYTYPSTSVDSANYFDGLHPSAIGAVTSTRAVAAAVVRSLAAL